MENFNWSQFTKQIFVKTIIANNPIGGGMRKGAFWKMDTLYLNQLTKSKRQYFIQKNKF